jgi:hypothetical protein
VRPLLPALVAAALAGLASPAFADAIDGNWCSEKTGKTMQIQGSSIVTPGGTRMTGRYSRHAFSYTVPEGEDGAGAPVAMRLLDENDVQMQVGEAGEPSMWHRCEQTS